MAIRSSDVLFSDLSSRVAQMPPEDCTEEQPVSTDPYMGVTIVMPLDDGTGSNHCSSSSGAAEAHEQHEPLNECTVDLSEESEAHEATLISLLLKRVQMQNCEINQLKDQQTSALKQAQFWTGN